MADVATSLKDFLFPARRPLRDAAEGTDTNANSKAAMARAAANPSGIDVAAEAAKRVRRPSTPATPAAPKKKKSPLAGKLGAQFMEN